MELGEGGVRQVVKGVKSILVELGGEVVRNLRVLDTEEVNLLVER